MSAIENRDPIPCLSLDGCTAEEERVHQILWSASLDRISPAAFRQLFLMLHCEPGVSNLTLSLLTGNSERTVARCQKEILNYGPDRQGAFPKPKSTAPRANEVKEFYSRDSKSKISWELRKSVYSRDGYACVECGRTTHLTVDHCIAVTSGGQTILENLRTLCIPCNCSKGAKNVRPVS